jgi:hypothetical protein
VSLVLVLSAALLAQTSPGAGMAVYRGQASVSGEVVRLGDVANLSALPAGLRDRAEALPIARFRSGQTQMSIRPDRLAEKARALMPVLAWRLPMDAQPILVRRSMAAAAPRPSNCLAAQRAMTAGDTPRHDDFADAPCGANRQPAFRYDSGQQAVRLIRDLKVGEPVAAPPASAFAGVRAGQPLVLAIKVGPVTVERQVVAVRPSAAGRPVFVRGDDSLVFSAPAPGEAQ